jgi:DNA polymerase elongation subunit (family B)
MKLLKIQKYKYEGFVYDLVVAKNKNFVADSVVIHNCAKKRYFMNVLDNEGVRYATPKLKVMGLEVVKSSTPGVIRKTLKAALSIILDEGEAKIQDYILKCQSEFSKFSIEEISFPRGVNGLSKYNDSVTIYSKGTPIHTKGSLLYNDKLLELGLENKYPLIGEGDKVKYTYLREPNPMKNMVISYPTELPVEFGLHKYVDFNMQFEKSFLAPLRNILDAIGWKTEKSTSIEDFFN